MPCDRIEEMRRQCDRDAAENAFGKKKESRHNWPCLGDGCTEPQCGSEVDLLPGANAIHP